MWRLTPALLGLSGAALAPVALISFAEAGNGRSGPVAAMAVSVLLVILVILLAILLVGGTLFDLAARREEEAEWLEERVADAVRAALGTVPIVVLADFPGSRRSPVVIELSGTVPNPELREAARGIVAQEMARIGREYQIDDRLQVSKLSDQYGEPATRLA
jgi:hypothetical protein